MNILLTGQGGMNRSGVLDSLEDELPRDRDLMGFHVGDRMYQAVPAVPRGRMLTLPLPQLREVRRRALRDIADEMSDDVPSILMSHATFRWKRGLFRGFELDELEHFEFDKVCVLVDDVDAVKVRLEKSVEYADHEFSLKDLLVWREEEIFASELLAAWLGLQDEFYIVPRKHAPTLLRQLLFEDHKDRFYLSFPITHITGEPDALAQVKDYKNRIRDLVIGFDPYALEEKRLEYELQQTLEEDEAPDGIEIETLGETLRLDRREVRSVVPDLNGQIVSRVFKMIDQSDGVIALVPEVGGRPEISAGVTRELQYAHQSGKAAYVVWEPAADPSPFIDDVATRRFGSVEECVDFLAERTSTP